MTPEISDLVNSLIQVIQTDRLKMKRNTFILIGGLARSGKSTLAEKLRLEFENAGFKSNVICLDHWILDFHKRTDEMTVRERFDYNTIVNSIRNLISLGEISWSKYDPKTRTHLSQKEKLNIDAEEVVIIEGVVSLDIPYLREISSVKIFLQIDEMVRKERFFEYYLLNDYKISYIEKLYEERLSDEYLLITETKKYASLIIN